MAEVPNAMNRIEDLPEQENKMDVVAEKEWEPGKMTCKDHPKYKAIYKPRCDCLTCWIMYEYTIMCRLSAVRCKIKEIRYGA